MPIPSQVHCVLFDAVGTLIYAYPPVSAVYCAAARDFGVTLDEATVERRFVQAFAKYNAGMQDGGEVTSEDNERQRWRAIVAAVFPELDSTDALFSRLWNHFAQPASWRVFDDVAECGHRLTSRGLLLGVASNFDERLLAICRGLPVLARCEHVFVSSRIGHRKPAAQFFRAIEEATALGPQELLLVGDDWESDYLAATAAGWQAIHLDRTGSDNRPAAIESLLELTH